MNYFNKLLQIILLIILNNVVLLAYHYISKIYTDEGYERLLKWGLEHSLKINDKIKLTEIKDEKLYFANKDISKDEIIFDIPSQLTLTINGSFSFLKSEFLKEKYHEYIIEHKNNNRTLDDISNIEQSFLAYILYIANNTKKDEYKALYEYYEPLYYIFEDEIEHLPSFFHNDQIDLFLNTTSFGYFFELINMHIMEEFNILKNKIFKEDIFLEQYLRFRFLIVQKSYNISNKITVVPFIDLINREFNKKKINCKLIVNKGRIKIKAIQNIRRGDLLTIKLRKMTNQYSFIFYGKTYDDLVNQTSSFIVPAVPPNLLNDEGIDLDINENEEENKIDLALPNLFEVLLPIYQDLARSLSRDDSNYACYQLILKYLKKIKNIHNSIDIEEIEVSFYDKRDSDNIKRIITGEKNFLEKKIDELNKIMLTTKRKPKIIKNNNRIEDL